MAYVQPCALRRLALEHTQFAKATCYTIRLKLLKIGALVRSSVRRIVRYPARRAAAAHSEVASGQLFSAVSRSGQELGDALIAVIQEAWIGGVSTRRVDDLVEAMGLSVISKSQVSESCKEIDQRVHAFLDRPLVG